MHCCESTIGPTCQHHATDIDRILAIMERVDSRALPSVNPCPSREEWEAMRRLLEANRALWQAQAIMDTF